MAKSQKRSSREIRKPKADKTKAAKPAGIQPFMPNDPLAKKPKGK